MSNAFEYFKNLTSTLNRWFDSHAELEIKSDINSNGIDWLRCLPFIILHLGCLGVIFVGWSWFAVSICVFLYLIRMFAITGFYHRYFSHNCFKTSRTLQFFFAVIGNSSTQRGPLWWAANHRHHHKFSDMKQDIHSPRHVGFWWSHMFWFTSRSHFPLKTDLIKDFLKFPELRFIDRYDTIIPILFGFLLFTGGNFMEINYPNLKTNGLQLLVWGFFVSTIVLFHVTCSTNSFSHMFGSRPFNTNDDSRNNFWVAILALGEGWHNNHHHSPSSVKQGIHWWQIDVTFYILSIMSWLGLVWDLRKPDIKPQINKNTLNQLAR